MLSSFRILSKIGGVALGAAIVALAAGYAPAKADEPGVVRLTALNGDVAVRRGDTSGTFAASANTPLMVSDYLSTGPGAAHAELQFDRGNFLRLGPNVQLRIAKLDPGDHTVQLAEGTVELSSLHPTSGHAEVDTPSIAVRPGSNGRYRVTVGSAAATLVTVRSGSADLVGTSATRTIDAGQTIAITGSPSDPRFENISFVASDDFDTWNQQRDTFDNNDTGYQYASPQIAGIPDLSQYGSWNNSQQYGMGWTPNDVGPNWSPYQDGQWTWEPGYGYTWIGNESWGWAPYHYGSWEYNGTSWAWYPNAQPTYNQYGSAAGAKPESVSRRAVPQRTVPAAVSERPIPAAVSQRTVSAAVSERPIPRTIPAAVSGTISPPCKRNIPPQYPPQAYPPPYAQGGYPYGYPPQAGYGYPPSPYGYGYPAANNSSVLWAPALVAFLGIMSGESAGQSLHSAGSAPATRRPWVPLAPGEPMYPWWGAQQSAWYGYPASTYYPNYQQYGYSQQPLSSSYTTYNVTNIYKVYRNARAPHGVMLVSTKAFQNGSFKTIRATSINDLKLEDGKVGSVAVFRNVVPVTPTAARTSASTKQARRALPRSRRRPRSSAGSRGRRRRRSSGGTWRPRTPDGTRLRRTSVAARVSGTARRAAASRRAAYDRSAGRPRRAASRCRAQGRRERVCRAPGRRECGLPSAGPIKPRRIGRPSSRHRAATTRRRGSGTTTRVPPTRTASATARERTNTAPDQLVQRTRARTRHSSVRRSEDRPYNASTGS